MTASGVGTIVNDDGVPPPVGIEGDVSDCGANAGAGDGVVNACDIALERSLVAGITPLAPAPSNQGQRADTSPYNPAGNSGDGHLDATDLAQVRRYANALDPPQTAGGPTTITVADPSDKPAESARTDATDSPEVGRIIRVVSTSTPANSAVTVSVQIDSQGDETALGFSLNFDQTKMTLSTVSGAPCTNPDIALGSGDPGFNLTCNASQAGSGRVGILLDSGAPLTAGTREIVKLTFHVVAGAAVGPTPVTFGNTPIAEGVSNAAAQSLPTTFDQTGTVTVTGPRTIRVVSTSAPTTAGKTFKVAIDMDAQGDEVALGFSVGFDPTKVSISNVSSSPCTNTDVALGSGAPGFTLTCNGSQAVAGNMGIGLDSGTPLAFGTRRIVLLTFHVLAGNVAGSTMPVTFGNSPIAESTSNAAAQALTTIYQNGTVTFLTPSAAATSINGKVLSAAGRGIGNATVSVTDSVGNVRTAFSNGFGFYQIDGVIAGETYVITASAKRYSFAARTITVSDDLAEVDLVSDN